MTYRETFDVDLDDLRPQRLVLEQHTTLGPWMALILGVMLVGFLTYLIYSNLLVPTPPPLSPERSLRVMTDSAILPGLWRSRRLRHQQSQWGPIIVPQNRTINTLVGGQGPALPPEYSQESTVAQNAKPSLSSMPQ